ncbi:MAG: MBL fold metallo-hydrolase [Synergistaceae bacterium]|nr:MBL fold metallo-hydrolase [Synergistaceae bacterium]
MTVKKIIPGLTQIMLTIPRGGFESFINAWLIKDEKRGRTVLIETGPASSVPKLLDDLIALGAGRIDYLVYTHVHMDHSGGAGQFIVSHPETKVIAPMRGRRHLVDPSRLIEGSRATLGDICDAYGMPQPLSEDALVPEDFELNGLEIIETPGHSPHHNSYIYDLDGARILFAGEVGGCCTEISGGGFFIRPATPHKFYYDTAISSLDKMLALSDIDLICYPHTGCSHKWRELLQAAKEQMTLWKEIISEQPKDVSVEEAVKAVMIKDPRMKLMDMLPEAEKSREKFFIRQSVNGYLGYIRSLENS